MVPTPSRRPAGDAENGGSRDADPSGVATAFFAALALQDWEDAVRYVEPRSLAEFRESQLAMFVSWVSQREEMRRVSGKEGLFGWSTDGVLRTETLEQHGDVRLNTFSGSPTLRELAALPAEAFASRFLAAARVAPAAYRVFGHVLEGDDIAHVVYRAIDAGVRTDPLDVSVLHVRRHDDRWHVLLSHDLADGAFILFHLDFDDTGETDPDSR
ncbi:MAG: hypothetical protein ACJ79A_15835 [Gemmatimonadaceae bacterium]